ncbi:MAG TPA: glycine zipper 2TM domain-containing protein [Rhodanobacteraceae bacterium]
MRQTIAVTLAMGIVLGLAGSGVASAQSANGIIERPDGIYIRCATCGTVQAITQNVSRNGGGNTAATIAGSVIGGLLGNQVGKGKGRALATIGGAVGGGAAGNAIGKAGSNGQGWTLRIKLGQGNFMNVDVADASGLRVGDLVEVNANGNVIRLR